MTGSGALEDRELATLFQSVANPIADDGFSREVLQRLASSRRARPAIVALAFLVGLTAAYLGDVWSVIDIAAVWLGALEGWLSTGSLTPRPVVVGGLMLGGLMAFLAAAVED